MPFQPYGGGGGGGGTDPLEMFMMLQQLQQSQQQAAERKKMQGLDMLLDLAGMLEPKEFEQSWPFVAQQHNLDMQAVGFARSANATLAKQRRAKSTEEFIRSPTGAAIGTTIGVGQDEEKRRALEFLQKSGPQFGIDPVLATEALQLGGAGIAAEQRLREAEANRQHQQSLARIGASEAAERRGIFLREELQLKAEKREELRKRQEKHFADAALQIAADPGVQPRIIQEAASIYGDGYARDLEMRLANQYDVAAASGKLAERDLETVIGETEAPPELANAYKKKRAQKDPRTGFLFYGDAAAGSAVSSLGHIYDVLGKYEVAAEQFARETGGSVVTGKLADLETTWGGGKYASFGVMQSLQAEYEEALLRYRTGAAATEGEIARIASLNPANSTLNIANGKLLAPARARFSVMRDNAESLYLTRFDRRQRDLVRSSLRDSSAAEIQRIRSDPQSWYNQLENGYSAEGKQILDAIKADANVGSPATGGN